MPRALNYVPFTHRIDMYYEGSRDFYYNFLTVIFMKTEEQVIKDARTAADDKYFPALEKVNTGGRFPFTSPRR